MTTLADEVQQKLVSAVKLQRNGQVEISVRMYRDILQIDPCNADASHLLGLCILEKDEKQEAIRLIQNAVAQKPRVGMFHNNLGEAYRAVGLLESAVTSYRRAARIAPEIAEIHYNLGNALRLLDQFDEATVCFKESLRLKPDDTKSWNNLGVTYQATGKFDDALRCYDKAVQSDLDSANSHWNRALLSLLLRDFETGWQDYEWRWKRKQIHPRHFSQPAWNGSSLKGKTLLLHAEQGLGDTIQFIRLVSTIQRRAKKVLFLSQKPLIPILSSLVDPSCLISEETSLPDFDFHCPLLSVPGLLGIQLDSIPDHTPYLFADNELNHRWRIKLEKESGFRIGIAWQGNPTHTNDLNRSIPIQYFLALAKSPNVKLLSLQKGPGADQLGTICGRSTIIEQGNNFDEMSGPFMDSAAAIMNLDLIITCDSAIAHLAGALGAPVWVALPFIPDWRWMLDRSDSPWYRSMRLFRQQQRGDWSTVFHEIATELDSFIAEKN